MWQAFIDWLTQACSNLQPVQVLMMFGWIISIFLSFVILPYLRRIVKQHHDQNQMIKKKLFEHTGVVMFGVFDKKIQSDCLGGFLTTLFGEILFHHIVEWNTRPSPSLIVPANGFEAEHMQEILAAHASPYVLQSKRIDCYFRDAERFGTEHYPFAKLVIGLARPDASKLTGHDYPRVVIIEQGMLKKLMNDPSVEPQWNTKDGTTWLETLRELGRRYFAGERSGITVLEVPLQS